MVAVGKNGAYCSPPLLRVCKADGTGADYAVPRGDSGRIVIFGYNPKVSFLACIRQET